MAKNRIVLAFSGGLDTSAILPWLIENYDAEVIAYCSDLGNSPDEKSLREWAKTLGASEFIFEDVQEQFVTEFVYPAIRAGATYQDDYLLGTALGRPLISERMAFYAKKFNATHIAHGATGKGNDQLRFEKSWAYLIPEVQVIAPWKIWPYTGREDLLKYIASKGFKMETQEKKYSVDVNLLHRSCEGGILESPEREYNPADIYQWVKPASAFKNVQDSVTIDIDFKHGFPTALNGKTMSAAKLLGALNEVAGAWGVGVVDLVEERANGLKSRGVYETPGGTLVHLGVKQLKHLCWDRPLMTLGRTIGQSYGELIYDGLWHSDSRKSVEAFFEKATDTLNGKVTIQLNPGQARVVKRESPDALYDEKMVSFESDFHGLHKYAEGYCKTVSFSQWRAGRRDAKRNK